MPNLRRQQRRQYLRQSRPSHLLHLQHEEHPNSSLGPEPRLRGGRVEQGVSVQMAQNSQSMCRLSRSKRPWQIGVAMLALWQKNVVGNRARHRRGRHRQTHSHQRHQVRQASGLASVPPHLLPPKAAPEKTRPRTRETASQTSHFFCPLSSSLQKAEQQQEGGLEWHCTGCLSWTKHKTVYKRRDAIPSHL